MEEMISEMPTSGLKRCSFVSFLVSHSCLLEGQE